MTMTSQRKLALITGASGGIGAELALLMAAKGHDLALVARSADKLEALATRIAATGRPKPLVIALDLGEPGSCDRLAAALKEAGADLDIVVNNAGFGLLGQAADLDRKSQLEMIDLNIRTLTDLSLRFVDDLARNKGRILNLSSVAAFQPGPGMAVYYATKAYVLSFSEALGHELTPRGVSVTSLCPGPTQTGFQERAKFSMDMPLMRLATTSVESVAKAGYEGMMARKMLVIPGALNKLTARLGTISPRSLLLPMIARVQSQRS